MKSGVAPASLLSRGVSQSRRAADRRTDANPMQRLSLPEQALWVCLVLGLVLWKTHFGTAPLVFSDSFQYFSVAEHVREGRYGWTSIINFDAERSFGAVPAPMITLSPGYGVLTGLVSLGGLAVERGAALVSCVATLLSLLVLGWIGVLQGLPRRWIRLVLAAFALNSFVLKYASAAMSEALFGLLAIMGLALLIRSLVPRVPLRGSWVLALLSGLSLGASYWVRSPGVFLVVGLCVLTLMICIERGPRASLRHVVASTVAIATVALGMARNVSIAGDWRGGETKAVSHGVLEVLGRTRTTLDDLMLGSVPLADSIGLHLLFVLSLAFATLVAWRGYVAWRRTTCEPSGAGRFGRLEIVLLGGSYIVCCVYAGFFTVLPYGPRLLAPAIPFVLLLGAGLATEYGQAGDNQNWLRWPVRIAIAMAIGSYGWLNLSWFRAVPSLSDPHALAQRLGAPAVGGGTLADMVIKTAGPDGVVVATEAATTGYLLGLPVIALAPTESSETLWDEAQTRAVVRRFGARVLLVNAPPVGSDPALTLPSLFLAGLLRGEAPAWLEPAGRSAHVAVYRVRLNGSYASTSDVPRERPNSQPRSNAIISTK